MVTGHVKPKYQYESVKALCTPVGIARFLAF
jgi:hypothetical protein